MTTRSLNYDSLPSGLPTGYLKPVQPAKMSVSIAIPAFNEEENIGDVLNRLNSIGYDNILVIDGLSKDRTLQVATQNGAKIVMQDGRGKGQAVRQVLSNNYLDSDALVLMDADGSMSADEVPRFVIALKEGADVAKGSRFIKGGCSHDMTALRRFGNKVMTSTVNLFCNSNYTDLCYGFVAFNRKAIKALASVLESNNFEIETEIFVKAQKLGLNVVEVPSTEYERRSGKSKLHTFRDGYKIVKTIFISSFQ